MGSILLLDSFILAMQSTTVIDLALNLTGRLNERRNVILSVILSNSLESSSEVHNQVSCVRLAFVDYPVELNVLNRIEIFVNCVSNS